MKKIFEKKINLLYNIFQEDVYLVGGAVRDYILGITPKDYDFAIGINAEEMLLRINEYNKNGSKIKVLSKESHKFGVVEISVDNESYEISAFRGYKEGVSRDLETTMVETIEEDLERRDFTINAMALSKKGLIDPFNGLSDLRNKKLKFVGKGEPYNVATRRIKEDSIRILRAIRFANRLDLDIDPENLRAIKDNLYMINNISNERFLSELEKSFDDGTGYIKSLINLLSGSYNNPIEELDMNIDQNNPAHNLPLLDHTLKAIEAYPGDFLGKLALLYHDTGKPSTRVEEGPISRYFGHHKKSVEIFSESIFAKALSNPEKEKVKELILFHDREIEPTEKAIRRLASQLKYNTPEELIHIQIADKKAQSEKQQYLIPELMNLINISREIGERITLKDLPVNGGDLIELGLRGPEIGSALKKLLEMYIDNPNLTKEELLNYI